MPTLAKLVSLVKTESQKSIITLFVGGTDTGIGKTYVTNSLVSAFNRPPNHGLAVGFKPISCGPRLDPKVYHRSASKRIPIDCLNPVNLPSPVAPMAQKCPSFSQICNRVRSSVQDLKIEYGARIILVEGAGGLLCPLSPRHTMLDLVQAFEWPVLLVAPNRLGVLNHVLLNLDVLNRRGMKVKGVILNQYTRGGARSDQSFSSNASNLSKLIRVPLYCF